MSIVKATRTHYAMLQHKQSPDRIPLDYTVGASNGDVIQALRLWVKASTNGQRKAALTRVQNVLQAMWPEAKHIACVFPDRTWAAEVIADSSGRWSGNGLRFGTQLQAEAYARDLYSRWTLVTEFRATPTYDPLNAVWNSTTGVIHL
jgi:hypothetical protein